MRLRQQILIEADKEGDVIILNKREALGIYFNLVFNFINHNHLYDETRAALDKISKTYNLSKL